MAFDFLNDLLPSIIEGGASIVGNIVQDNAADDALGVYREGAQEGANILSDAYRDLEGIYGDFYDYAGAINDERFTNIADLYRGVSQDFNDTLSQSALQYSQDMTSGSDQFSKDLMIADNLARQDMGSALRYAEESLSPYTEGGDAAMAENLRVMNQDPSQLTPSQRIARERYMDDARATLSASGLRGAGKAGVSSVLRGLSDFDAAAYDQNQQRSDASRSALTTAGYNASAREGDYGYRTGTGMAEGTRGAINTAATGRFGAQEKVADNSYNTGQRIAANNDEWGGRIGGLTGEYYDRAVDTEAGRADATQGFRLGAAGAQSAAVSNPAYAQAQNILSRGRGRAETIGEIGSVLRDIAA